MLKCINDDGLLSFDILGKDVVSFGVFFFFVFFFEVDNLFAIYNILSGTICRFWTCALF